LQPESYFSFEAVLETAWSATPARRRLLLPRATDNFVERRVTLEDARRVGRHRNEGDGLYYGLGLVDTSGEFALSIPCAAQGA
jgi:hypothetical protein